MLSLLRVYNTGLVVLVHTVLTFISVPIANTKYPETMHQKGAVLFLASGPLCVATFFFISSFLLSNGLFEHMNEKKMNLKTVAFAFANRIFRLTPTVFVVVLFHATLLRHLGNGPNWHHFMGEEYRKCKKNGWTNVLFINNWVDYNNMCLPITWYLALDTQYFLISLFFLWLLKANEKRIWYIVGAAISLNIVGTFSHTYYYDFNALAFPNVEIYYGMERFFNNKQFHYQLCSFIGNFTGPLIGMAAGYIYFKHKNDKEPIFRTKARKVAWWLIAWGGGLGLVLIPGPFILDESAEHDRFWAAVYVALSRPIFCLAISVGFLGVQEGYGWLTVRALRWGPLYVLGRLTFSTYLIHMTFLMLRPALARYPLYITDYQVFVAFFGDLMTVYFAALLLNLFVEMPVSELQKIVFSPGDNKAKERSQKSE